MPDERMDAIEVIEEGSPGEPSMLPVAVEQHSVTLFRTDDPQEIVTRAVEVADVLSRVLREKNLISMIKGREHVRVEGWTFCGTMLGVFPVVEWTRKTDDGWEARVEARTLAGAVVGAAEAECLRSESTWSSRDDYAIRSMAQTRAISKALRGPLGFVVSLAGFETTPEEEMPGGGSHGQQAKDPGRDLPPGFTGKDLPQRIAEATKAIDTTVDWLATWDNAINARFSRPRAELSKNQTREAWCRLANVVAKLTEGPGDFPPPTDDEIQAVFAEMWEGVSIVVERKEGAVVASEPVIDESIEFGEAS